MGDPLPCQTHNMNNYECRDMGKGILGAWSNFFLQRLQLPLFIRNGIQVKSCSVGRQAGSLNTRGAWFDRWHVQLKSSQVQSDGKGALPKAPENYHQSEQTVLPVTDQESRLVQGITVQSTYYWMAHNVVIGLVVL